MKLDSFLSIAVISGSLLSCSDSTVVPAPCRADGRNVSVWYSAPNGNPLQSTGSFVGWNEYWVSIELDNGEIEHVSMNSIYGIHEFKK